MKCEKCKKVCMEDELIQGYCYECRSKYQKEYNKNNEEMSDVTNRMSKENNNIQNSTVGKLTFIINATWIFGVLSALILGIYLIIQEAVVDGIVTMIVLPFLTWLSTIVLEAFKEIIVLLQDLKNK